jgi:TonB-linked SusC/RagA family outer membrane protein
MQYNYFKKSILMLFMLVMVNIDLASAQDIVKAVAAGQVSGKVFNQFRVPIKGVKVTVSKTTETAVTDTNGVFVIAAQKGSVLNLSAKGYNASRYTINRADKIAIQLSDQFLKNPDKLDVLYNTVSTESNLSAVSTIYTNQLTTTPASLYTYALPGQLAGLYTQQQSGFGSPQAGSPTTNSFLVNYVTSRNITTNDNNGQISLQVRGAINAYGYQSQPITIIDGVQRELSSIDPETIESVSVLKDGLSTILLGINSSNAVLLITTKKAQIGKTLISFTAQTAIQQSLGLPTPLPAYQYAYLYNEALQNDGKQPLYTTADFNAYLNHTDPIGHPDVNWFNTILRKNSPMRNYKLNITGGTNIARYSVSLNYLNQEGILNADKSLSYNTNNNLSRYILNSDVNISATKNFNIDLQLFGRVQSIGYPGQGASGFNGIFSSLFGTPNNTYPALNPNGSFGGINVAPYQNNLLAMSQYSGYSTTQNHDILTNLDLNYNMGDYLKGLSLRAKGNFAINSQNYIDRSLQNSVYQYNPDGSYTAYGTTRSQSNSFNNVSNSRYSYAQAAIAYDNSFGKNNFNALLFYDFRSVILTFDLPRLTQNRALQVSYNYDGKYFLTGAVNNSGDDRYPPGHRFGTYYAGGIGWQMGKESFIKDNISWIDSWKWRATYGNTGNGNAEVAGYFGYRKTYDSANGDSYPQGTGYGGGSGYGETNGLVNPNLNPERAHKINVGTDISLFKNKLLITADYFHERYYDLLKARGNSNQLIGAIYPYENLGINLMQGGELTVTHQSHVGDFNYFITGNATLLKTTIVFADELKPLYPWMVKTGNQLTTLYGYQSLGFFQTQQDASTSATTAGYTAKPGDIKYKDQNNDGIIDQNDVVAIGNTKPLIYYGLNFGFNYKGFNVSAILQGVGNNQTIYSQGDITQGFMGKGGFGGAPYGQAYTTILNRWTPETAATATTPRLTLNANSNNGAASTFYLHSANYVRLKNAEVGYTIPHIFTSRLGISSLRFFVNGENLVTIAGYKGLDPEVNGLGYPIQRVYNAGVSIKL